MHAQNSGGILCTRASALFGHLICVVTFPPPYCPKAYRSKKMKILLLLAAVFIPTLAFAEYNSAEIKQRLSDQQDSFQISGWKLSENGVAFIAITGIKGMVLSVNESDSGFIASLENSAQAMQAIIRCLTLGDIGMSPEDENQRGRIVEVVHAAVQSQAASTA